MYVTDLFDGDLLEQMIQEGYVRKTAHPSLPLYTLGYSEKAQFERRWNEVTIGCRGLICTDSGTIVARPWKKFFNFGEGNIEIDMEMPVEVTDKVDGSLGILYPVPNGWAIATRGSFASDQAIHATKVWQERYQPGYVEFGGFRKMVQGFTYLFEIVYPANRIVLNYGDQDDLVLLGAVNIERGFYIGPREAVALLDYAGPFTKTFDYKNMQDAFSADPRPNAEGFVIRSGNKMVKIKQTDYIELHRIVTNLNERTVWQLMMDGKTVEQICEPIPDEWHDWVREIFSEIWVRRFVREGEILDEYAGIEPGLDRKAFAAVASKSKNKAYLFKLYDGKPIADMLLAELRPTVSKE